MREGELFGLTWPKVNLRDGTLQVTQQLVEGNGHPYLATPKTRAAIRQIDLPTIALLALREHRERALAEGTLHNSMGLVFTDTDGKPLRRSNFLRRDFGPSLSVTEGSFAHSMKYHERPAVLSIGGVKLENLEARNVLRELLDAGMVEYYSGAIYRLTPEGVSRAQELRDG